MTLRHSFLLCLLLCLTALCPLAGLFAAPDPAPLRVGMELASPPFEMADTQGKPAGVSVDLAFALGEHLKRPVLIQNLPFDGLIPSLRTGRIDLIISSMTATPERAKIVTFSDPYLTTGLCLLIGKNSKLQSVADLDQKHHVVAVKQGTTGHLYARTLQNARVVVLDRESACVLEVVQSKADAFIYDQFSVLKYWEQNPDTTRAVLQAFQTESWAVALRKGDAPLQSEVNAFLNAYRATGGFDRLAERWLAQPKKTFLRLGVPFVF
jgi:polar amino acid transport system substrate-binding protein